MKWENKESIFDLYECYRTKTNDFVICESISSWLGKEKIPLSEFNISYKLKDVNFSAFEQKFN